MLFPEHRESLWRVSKPVGRGLKAQTASISACSSSHFCCLSFALLDFLPWQQWRWRPSAPLSHTCSRKVATVATQLKWQRWQQSYSSPCTAKHRGGHSACPQGGEGCEGGGCWVRKWGHIASLDFWTLLHSELNLLILWQWFKFLNHSKKPDVLLLLFKIYSLFKILLFVLFNSKEWMHKKSTIAVLHRIIPLS